MHEMDDEITPEQKKLKHREYMREYMRVYSAARREGNVLYTRGPYKKRDFTRTSK